MKRKKTRLGKATQKAELALSKTNEKIAVLGENSIELYKQLSDIQRNFDKIRNIPSDDLIRYNNLKQMRLSWKQQAEKIESDYKAAQIIGTRGQVAGVVAGATIAALGPSLAMGIATTFGVASTGTAISSLAGAAAKKAALTWMGGGAIAAGGGGMAAGRALLRRIPLIGWIISFLFIILGVFFLRKIKKDQRRLEAIFSLISERDTKKYDLATVELNERITRIQNETSLIKTAVERIQTFGFDYTHMTENQQYELGSYVNLMNSSTQLLVNPILGLQPDFTEQDFLNFEKMKTTGYGVEIPTETYKDLVIGFSNLFYAIKVSEKNQKLLWKSYKHNKKFLQAVKLKKKEFVYAIVADAFKALNLKTKTRAVA